MLDLACRDHKHTFAWETPGDCPSGTPCLCGKTFWGQEPELIETPKVDPILDELDALIGKLRARKGVARSDMARHLAVVITELEKAYAYYLVFCSTEML